MKQIQNNPQNPDENADLPMIIKISRKKSANPNSQDFCQMFVLSKKKARTLGKKSIGRLWI
jgi:hypothetical protein